MNKSKKIIATLGSYAGYKSIKNPLADLKFDDWFLPSRDSVLAMCNNLHGEGVGGFDGDGFYWSSSETQASGAFMINFVVCMSFDTQKNNVCKVRPCRSFEDEVGAYQLRDVGPAGGLIYYISGTTFYEAAPEDQGEVTVWSNIDDVEIGVAAQGVLVGTGKGNTEAIIGQAGHVNSAAKICDDYLI